jgi:hypothetical protein
MAALLRIALGSSLRRGNLSHPEQPALFSLIADCPPRTERTASGRYLERTLFAGMTGCGEELFRMRDAQRSPDALCLVSVSKLLESIESWLFAEKSG